ncbi:putative HTH-type transcriptional regulator YvdT [Peptococcaceae bacterium CEB3]|nr:putative HTH-type transcriptional regulator YvdT [Peptococcaceae bacterium CEB3]
MKAESGYNRTENKKRERTYQAKTDRGEATRQKLLLAAEEVFGEKGFHGASIVEITLKAGVAQGTFYLYFPSKETIFEELVRELNHDLRREISVGVSGAKNRQEAEERGFQIFFAFIKEHRNLYRIVQEIQFVDEELYKWYYSKFAEGYIEGLEKAMAAGEYRYLDPETVAYAMIGVAEFLGMRWVLWQKEDIPPKALSAALELIMGGVLPRQ